MYSKVVMSGMDVNNIILNTLNDVKTHILQRDWGKVENGGFHNQVLLPGLALKIVNLINETLKTNPIPTEKALQETLKLIESIPPDWSDYQDTREITNSMCGIAVALTEIMIKDEMEQYSRLESKIEKWYHHNMGVLLKNIQMERDAGLSDVQILLHARENIDDIREKYVNELAKPEIQMSAQKEAKYFRDKISPFYERLESQKNLVSDVNKDLGDCLNLMIQQTDYPEEIVTTRVNAFNEIEVSTNYNTLNLTQILKHEPNYSKLDPESLDAYKNHVASKSVFKTNINNLNYFIQDNYGNNVDVKTSEQLMSELDATLKEGENNFDNCHIAHCMAIHIYTSNAYAVLNTLLRQKYIPKDLFADKPGQDKLVTIALKKVEIMLRGVIPPTGADLTAEETNRLTQEAVMAIGIASAGLARAKHIEFDPSKQATIINGELDNTQSRMVRGAAGDWVSGAKKNYALASEAGMPMYNAGFVSSSFSTQAAGNFITDLDKHLVTKITTYGADLQSNSGVMVNGISAFKSEREYLFPPGTLVLPSAESEIKNRQNYGVLTSTDIIQNKVAQVFTTENSAKSQFYSPSIQQKRMGLIKEYERLLSYKAEPEAITQKKHELETAIQQLETQLKKMDIVVVKTLPDTFDINAICGQADAVFLVSGDGQTLYIDKYKQEVTPVPLDIVKAEKLYYAMELNDGFNKLTTPDEMIRAHQSIDLVKIAWIEKLAGMPIECAFTEETTLKMHAKTFEKWLPDASLNSSRNIPQTNSKPAPGNLPERNQTVTNDSRVDMNLQGIIPDRVRVDVSPGNPAIPASAPAVQLPPANTPKNTAPPLPPRNTVGQFKERLAAMRMEVREELTEIDEIRLNK